MTSGYSMRTIIFTVEPQRLQTVIARQVSAGSGCPCSQFGNKVRRFEDDVMVPAS